MIKKRVIIIGGGISGLVAAFELAQNNVDFLLLEASDRTGGIIKTQKRDGFILEHGPDAFLSEKPETVELARSLKIETELISTNDENRRSFIVRENRLRAVPEGFHLLAPSNLESFFASELLSEEGKIRLAEERFLPPAEPKEDESLADFVRRRFGDEALERIAQPMIGGIYTANPETLSLRATQPRFLDLEQKFGSVIEGIQNSKLKTQNSPNGASGARYSMFLSFREGMQFLTDKLAESLPENSVRLNTKARKINFEPVNSVWQIETDSENVAAEAAILALPAQRIAKLLENQFSSLANELAAIEYASTATVNLSFRREQISHPLNGFGFVVPFVEKRTLMACTFASVKFSARAPENHVLLRAFVGGALQPEMFTLSDEEMIAGVLKDLGELIGASGEPFFVEITRWARSMPQYAVGHLRKAEKIKNLLAEIPALQLATTAFDGVGIPDSIRHGQTAARNIISAWH